jgi:hypothetical protein
MGRVKRCSEKTQKNNNIGPPLIYQVVSLQVMLDGWGELIPVLVNPLHKGPACLLTLQLFRHPTQKLHLIELNFY